MELHLLKTNGLFTQAADGKLLFFATPTARSAYIVPDRQHEDALRTLSKYWGLCELFSIALIAPVALHFGALVLLAAFAIFAAASALAYQFSVLGMVSRLESVSQRPSATAHAARLGNLLRTAADEIHPGLLWPCEAASIVLFMSTALSIFSGHRMHHHFLDRLLAIAFFGSATIAGAYMIAMKHRPAVSGTPSFAAHRAATDS
jgi:hypothetical protein